jgi:hypothetical protein
VHPSKSFHGKRLALSHGGGVAYTIFPLIPDLTSKHCFVNRLLIYSDAFRRCRELKPLATIKDAPHLGETLKRTNVKFLLSQASLQTRPPSHELGLVVSAYLPLQASLVS